MAMVYTDSYLWFLPCLMQCRELVVRRYWPCCTSAVYTCMCCLAKRKEEKGENVVQEKSNRCETLETLAESEDDIGGDGHGVTGGLTLTSEGSKIGSRLGTLPSFQ